jgi:hypothetical protein
MKLLDSALFPITLPNSSSNRFFDALAADRENALTTCPALRTHEVLFAADSSAERNSKAAWTLKTVT